ncbi:MAG: phosphatidylserine decarboxylase family protein [Bacteroidota bacterium]
MFRIHKEGYASILITLLFVTGLHLFSVHYLADYFALRMFILAVCIFLLVIVLQFFRNPVRKTHRNDKQVIAPADGKVVVIEVTNEDEVLKDRRIQVSIFMSPLNVHVNRYPVSGEVTYCRYHPGLYLVAWHPKSSTENERTTVVIETGSKKPVLMRQIAGALARRIVCYPQRGWMVKQGQEMGFIKFGSRVDLFLPLGTKVLVDLQEKVRGGETVIAEFQD